MLLKMFRNTPMHCQISGIRHNNQTCSHPPMQCRLSAQDCMLQARRHPNLLKNLKRQSKHPTGLSFRRIAMLVGHTSQNSRDNRKIELWHTRLGVLAQGTVLESIDALRTIRAIWSPDSDASLKHAEGNPPTDDSNPFRSSLDRRDRYELVQLTSNFASPFARARGGATSPSRCLWTSRA